MLFVPVGLADSRVDRLPWVCITIAAICGLFYVGSLVAGNSAESALQSAAVYWAEHPYLLPPPELEDRLLPVVIQVIEDQADRATMPEAAQVWTEQQRLNQLTELGLAAEPRSFLRKFSLVPARGWIQIGWLTSLFLHFGFLHLFFNMLFFYCTGPFLEDKWGRPAFLAFYLVGGLLASVAQRTLDPDSMVMMAGASGAVAACMGAFAFRFAASKVKIFYFLFIKWGVVEIPGWFWSILWFAGELASLAASDGVGGGVAFVAHVGGWLFGFVFALLLATLRVEQRMSPSKPWEPPARLQPWQTPAPVEPHPAHVRPSGLILGGIAALLAISVTLRFMPTRVDKRPTGTVSITSSPSGAAVSIDGVVTDKKTPCVLSGVRLRAPLRVSVSLDDHRSLPVRQDLALQVSRPDQEIDFQLIPVLRMQVSSKPEGALVYLDGRPLKRTPMWLPALDVGSKAELELILDDHMSKQQTLLVSKDSLSVSMTLEPSTSIDVESEPPGATIWVQGKQIGLTPENLKLPRDRRVRMEFKKPGFRTGVSKILPRQVRGALKVRLLPLPLSSLPLSPEERQEINAAKRELDSAQRALGVAQRRLTKARRTAEAAPQGRSIYAVATNANSLADLEIEVDDLSVAVRTAEQQVEDIRAAAIRRLSQ